MRARHIPAAGLAAALTAILALAPLAARGQEAPEEEASPEEPAAEVPPEVRERLRQEILADLRAEMERSLEAQKEEIRQEVRAEVAANLAAEAWEPEEWEVEEAPSQTFVDLDGYFRTRMDLFSNFDLNAGLDPDGRPLYPRPPWSPQDSDTLAGVNSRLRLQPVFNVAEGLSIHTQIDILDNLVWGSYAGAGGLALLDFTGSAVEPVSGINSVFDSIAVKRAWAEVLTPVGLLAFGRMGSHWGLGVLNNDGNCLDCDYGDTVDRVMMVTRIGGFWVVPAVDFPLSGPTLRRDGLYQGQPVDLEQRDDVAQYVLTIAKRDEPGDIEKQILEGESVLNYGLYNALRVQHAAAADPDAVAEGELARDDFAFRDALIYVPDLWVRYNTRQLRLELEAVGVFGSIGESAGLIEGVEGEGQVDVLQFGGVAQAEYTAPKEKLRIGFEAGFASGDPAPGFGIRDYGRYGSEGAIDGRQYNLDPGAGQTDDALENFLFDQDYHVDLILFREILGRVTDAWYVKPTFGYDFTPDFSFDAWAVYSQAIYPASTPGASAPLGVELDGQLSFRSDEGLMMAFQYGILFPLAGLDVGDSDAEIAQTIQGFLGVEF